jgi:hypothetical protein
MNRWPRASARKKLKSAAEKIEKKMIDIESLLEALQGAVDDYQSALIAREASSGFRNLHRKEPPLLPPSPELN